TTSPNGGFLNRSYQNQAESYFLGVDALPRESRSVLAGDGNIRAMPGSLGCSSGIAGIWGIFGPPWTTGWNDAVHGLLGNVLFHDGQVEQLSSSGLINAIGVLKGDENGSLHYVLPYPYPQ